MFLTDLEGTLMHRDTPLAYFKIKDKRLIEYRRIRKEDSLFPPEFVGLVGPEVTYYAINHFFRERVVLDGAERCQQLLDELGLKRYDFNAIVNLLNGRNYIDYWWIASEDFHPTWAKIVHDRDSMFTVREVDVPWPKRF